MYKLKLFLALLLIFGTVYSIGAQGVQIGAAAYVPSTTDSTLGQTAVNFTSDANCTVVTATNCTVSGGVSGPYLGTLNITSTGSLTTQRDVIVVLSPGRDYVIYNKTTGGQAIRIIGPSGAGYVVPNSATIASVIYSDGVNYGVPNVKSWPIQFPATTGFMQVDNAGVITYQAGVLPYCGGPSCPSQYIPVPTVTPPTTTSNINSTVTSIPINNCANVISPGGGVFVDVGSAVNNEWIAWTGCISNTLTGVVRNFYAAVPGTGASHLSASTIMECLQCVSASVTSNPIFYVLQSNVVMYGAQNSNAGAIGLSSANQTKFLSPVIFNGLPTSYMANGIHAAHFLAQNPSITGDQSAEYSLQAQGQIVSIGVTSSTTSNSYGGPRIGYLRTNSQTGVPGFRWYDNGDSETNGAAGVKQMKLRGSSAGTRTDQAAPTTTDYLVTHPATQGGSGQTEQNDGAGNLSWASTYSLGGTLSNTNVTPGTAGGVGTTASVSGYDGTSGVSVLTGASPLTGTNTLVTVTFTTVRRSTGAGYCTASPTDAGTAQDTADWLVLSFGGGGQGYVISWVGTGAPRASYSYNWNVNCP